MSTLTTHDLTLEPEDGARLSNLAGPLDQHLRQIEMRLGVEIANRGNLFRVIGEERTVKATARLLQELYAATAKIALSAHDINLYLQEAGVDALVERTAEEAQDVVIRVKRGVIKGRGPNQAKYLHAIAMHDINFGIGPAGTGKTYLAVASAVDAL
jgi:phosphate starvation-inducible PhoH-like protein